MPIPTPLHARTARLCESYAWKEWAGRYAVRRYGLHVEPEYHALRHAAGLLDVSPLYKTRVTGPDAAAFLSYVMTRDVERLPAGRVAYACLCDAHGQTIDDGTLLRLAASDFRWHSASPALAWLSRQRRGFRVDCADESDELAVLAVQGPTSRAVLAAVTEGAIDETLRPFGWRACRVAGHDLLVSRTGYTGDLGYELWFERTAALAVWDALLAAGRPYGIEPVGLDALDVTRLEAGFVLQDVEYTSALRTAVPTRRSSPYELGLGRLVELDRAPFIGQPALEREHARGPQRALVALVIDAAELERLHVAAGVPLVLPAEAWRALTPVHYGGAQVGYATSGAYSPLLKASIALAIVQARHATPGTRLGIERMVETERHTVTATVTPRPLFDPPRRRT